jgi:hypothetical protein
MFTSKPLLIRALTCSALASLTLLAVPPKAEAAASSSTAALSGASGPELAYLADLRAMGPRPLFLGLPEARILASHLGVGLELYQQDAILAPNRGRVALRHVETLNPAGISAANPHALRYHDRHFTVLRQAELPEQAGYYLGGHAGEPGYYETGEVRPGSHQPTPVPGDGHCLIASLYFTRHQRFPDQATIAELRSVLASRLSPEQIRHNLQDLRDDLLANATLRTLEGGVFSGMGRAVSAQFLADPAFMTAWGRARASYLRAEQAILAKPWPASPRLELPLAGFLNAASVLPSPPSALGAARGLDWLLDMDDRSAQPLWGNHYLPCGDDPDTDLEEDWKGPY